MRAVAAARITDCPYAAEDAARGMNWETTPHPVDNVLAFPNMGPLTGITHRQVRRFAGRGGVRTFYVVLHMAYNAFGLIGTEHNGVAVLDADGRDVLVSTHCSTSSGYFGPTQTQIDEWARVCRLTYAQLRAFVNGHPRCRREI
jgi:hypothetical protein